MKNLTVTILFLILYGWLFYQLIFGETVNLINLFLIISSQLWLVYDKLHYQKGDDV